jgi:hypothetical protein
VEGTGPFHPGASRNERERSNEQERIANEWFTSMGVGGCVTAREDHGRTTKTMTTVHANTLAVPFDKAMRLT